MNISHHRRYYEQTMAFLEPTHLVIEMIEPVAKDPSHRKEYLDTQAEGILKIAFWVKGLFARYLGSFASARVTMVPHGAWDGG